MKADHATWETGLVIPEPVKSEGQQLLEAFLRVEALLVQLLGQRDALVCEGAVADQSAAHGLGAVVTATRKKSK